MSSTIGIIPTENKKITFGEIINLSEKHINSSLNIVGQKEIIKLQITILNYDEAKNKESYLEVNLKDIFEWKKNQFPIFSIKGISGVIKTDYDIIFDSETIDDPWWKLNTCKDGTKTIHNLEDKLEKAKKTNKSWFLHRSDEKDKVINVCCAIISASIAELTSGLISSSDQTWGFGQYFIEKEEFLRFYLQPEKNITHSLKSKKVAIKSNFWYKLKKIFNLN